MELCLPTFVPALPSWYPASCCFFSCVCMLLCLRLFVPLLQLRCCVNYTYVYSSHCELHLCTWRICILVSCLWGPETMFAGGFGAARRRPMVVRRQKEVRSSGVAFNSNVPELDPLPSPSALSPALAATLVSRGSKRVNVPSATAPASKHSTVASQVSRSRAPRGTLRRESSTTTLPPAPPRWCCCRPLWFKLCQVHHPESVRSRAVPETPVHVCVLWGGVLGEPTALCPRSTGVSCSLGHRIHACVVVLLGGNSVSCGV